MCNAKVKDTFALPAPTLTKYPQPQQPPNPSHVHPSTLLLPHPLGTKTEKTSPPPLSTTTFVHSTYVHTHTYGEFRRWVPRRVTRSVGTHELISTKSLDVDAPTGAVRAHARERERDQVMETVSRAVTEA